MARRGSSRYRGLGSEEERVLVDAGDLRGALHDHSDAGQGQRHQPVLPTAAAQPGRHLMPAPAGPPKKWAAAAARPAGSCSFSRAAGSGAVPAAGAGGTTTPVRPRCSARPLARRREDYKSRGAPRAARGAEEMAAPR